MPIPYEKLIRSEGYTKAQGGKSAPATMTVEAERLEGFGAKSGSRSSVIIRIGVFPKDGDNELTDLTENGIELSLENLLGFPWIAERVADGRLRLHGAHFDVRSGILTLRQPGGGFAVVPP